MSSLNRGEWRATFRVESITPAEPDNPGWLAYDLTLRPMDKRGRTNGRAKELATLHVGGEPGTVNLSGLEVGRKVEFTYADGPAPTRRAVIKPDTGMGRT